MQKNINGIINCCTGNPISLAEQVESFIKEHNLDIKLDKLKKEVENDKKTIENYKQVMEHNYKVSEKRIIDVLLMVGLDIEYIDKKINLLSLSNKRLLSLACYLFY